MRTPLYMLITWILTATPTGCTTPPAPADSQQMQAAQLELCKAKIAAEWAEVKSKEADTRIKLAQIQQIEAQTQALHIENQLREIEITIKQAQAIALITDLNRKPAESTMLINDTLPSSSFKE